MLDYLLLFSFLAASSSEFSTPCQQRLGLDGDGKYPRMISQQFLSGVVQFSGPEKNLFCECTGEHKMVCKIVVDFQSFKHEAVKHRIGTYVSRPQKADLKPFFAISKGYA